MKWTVGAKLATGFGVGLAIFIAIGAVSYQSTRTFMETSERVTHTHEVLGRLEAVLSLLKDAETGQRGYLLTGFERYLEPYNQASKDPDTEVKQIRELTSDNPNQQVRLDPLESLIADKLAELEETIELRRSRGIEAAVQIVVTDEGKRIMDDIRKLDGEMKNE